MDAASMLRTMERLGMQRAVLSSLRAVFEDADAGNQELAELVRRHPQRFSGLATFDPRRAVAPQTFIARAQESGLSGLALFPAHHGYTLGRAPDVEKTLNLAAGQGWPVLIPIRLIMSWWLPMTPVEDILDTVARHPSAQFIIASGSYGELEAMLRAMQAHENLYLDLSGLQSLDIMVELTTRGDPQRILFGSGQPLQMPECNLVKLNDARLDAETQAAILWANAARLFNHKKVTKGMKNEHV